MSEEHAAGEALLRTEVIVPVRIVDEAVVSRAAEGQATPDLASARRSCDRLIAQLEPCLGRLQRLRRRIG